MSMSMLAVSVARLVGSIAGLVGSMALLARSLKGLPLVVSGLFRIITMLAVVIAGLDRVDALAGKIFIVDAAAVKTNSDTLSNLNILFLCPAVLFHIWLNIYNIETFFPKVKFVNLRTKSFFDHFYW